MDLDEKAIALARENGNANQVRPTLSSTPTRSATCGKMNVNGRTFGVVVLDPPKLIPGRLDIAPGKRKYFDLNVLAMSIVEPGGMLLTCSCSGLLAAGRVPDPASCGGAEGGAISADSSSVSGARPTIRWPGCTRRCLPQGRSGFARTIEGRFGSEFRR